MGWKKPQNLLLCFFLEKTFPVIVLISQDNYFCFSLLIFLSSFGTRSFRGSHLKIYTTVEIIVVVVWLGPCCSVCRAACGCAAPAPTGPGRKSFLWRTLLIPCSSKKLRTKGVERVREEEAIFCTRYQIVIFSPMLFLIFQARVYFPFFLKKPTVKIANSLILL